MSPLELTDEQKAIVADFGGNMFVSAGAGSGKTSVVIEGVIDVLKRGETAIDQVLTITFTDKAAGQMMRKARELLAEKGMHEERRNIEKAHISTIHSFCSRLIRRYALTLGLDPGFAVADEARSVILKEESFRECLDRFVKARGDEALRLIEDYDSKLEGELFKVIDGIHDELRSRGMADPDFPMPPGDLETAEARLQESVREALAALDESGSGADALRGKLEGLLDALELDEPRERLKVLLKVRPSTNCKVPDAIQAVLDRRSECIDMHYLPVLELLRELLRDYAAEYRSSKRRAALLDFEDLQLEALRLLDEREGIRERVAESFRLIVVDEFQDTNGLQCRIIERIARDNVCFVGDEQQSIYRFRHANVELFKRERDKAQRQGRVKPLSTNFRSQEEILTFVDYIFGREGMLSGAGYVKMRPGAKKEKSAVPRVDIILVDGDPGDREKENKPVARAAEAELVARRLEQLYQSSNGLEAGDTVILLRKRAQADIFRAALDRRGIQNYLSIGQDYFRKMELGDAMSLLRILVNPLDDAALIGVLRSPMVGLNDDTLFMLRQIAGRGDKRAGAPPLWETVTYAGTLEKLPADQAGPLKEFLASYERMRHMSRRQPLERTVRQVIDFRDYAAVAAAGEGGRKAFANLLKLVDLAVDFEAAWGRDPAAFVDFLVQQHQGEAREGDAPTEEEGSGSVQIMTIHSAKGLQFPLVVWSLMGDEFSHRRKDFVVGEDGRVGLWDKNLEKEDRARFDFTAVDDDEAERGLAEEKRIGYVAMTRPQKHLLLSGMTNLDKPAGNLGSRAPIEWVKGIIGLGPEDPELAQLREDESAPTGAAAETGRVDGCPVTLTVCTDPEAVRAAAAAAATTNAVDIEPLDTELLGIEPPEPRYTPSSISASAFSVFHKCPRRYYLERDLRLDLDGTGSGPSGGELPGHIMGSLVHRVLELAPMTGAAEVDASTANLERILKEDLGSDIGMTGDDAARAARLLGNLGSMISAQRLFRAAEAERLFREYGFSILIEGTVVSGVIDALCREDGGVLIVDYKTDRLEGDEEPGKAARHHGMQMDAYAVAASRLGWGDKIEVSLFFLDREGAEVHRSFDPAGITAARERLAGIIDSMGDGLFPPLPDFDMAYCPGCVGFAGRHKLCSTAAGAGSSAADRPQ